MKISIITQRQGKKKEGKANKREAKAKERKGQAMSGKEKERKGKGNENKSDRGNGKHRHGIMVKRRKREGKYEEKNNSIIKVS